MTAPEVVPCGHCGRPLTDPESRALGYGPVCAAVLWPIDTHHTPIPRGPRRRQNVNQIPLPLETPVDLETRKAAIDTIARHALARAVERDVTTNRIDWGDHPELSYDDFDAVLARVQKLAESLRPTAESYQAAYEHLTAPTTVQKGQRK